MKNDWTGGQYSILRAIAGIVLFVHFLAWADVSLAVRIVASMAAVLFMIGWLDRLAAVALWCALAYVASPSLPFAESILLVHVFVPPAPFGSLAAKGRIDPRGGWSMPPRLFAMAWIVMSIEYALHNDWTMARLLFAPLALFREARPWIWMAMLLLHIIQFDFTMAALHLFLFDPGWIPRRVPGTVDTVLYDGTCGLCHRSVRFLIAEDSHSAFRFAPLEGDADSIVVQTSDGRVLLRSDAVVHLLHRLGGLWRVCGATLSIVPLPVRNAWYDFIARVRYRIFGRTKDACPLMPPDLRSRFDV